MPIDTGTKLDGRYRVEELIGEQETGECYGVRDPSGAALAAYVARESADERAREQFVRIARASQQIDSEHATRVYRTGTLEDGRPYAITELPSGEPLSSRLQRTGPMSIDEASSIAVQLCDALCEGHARDLVHGAVSPDNVHVRRGANRLLRATLTPFVGFAVRTQALAFVAPECRDDSTTASASTAALAAVSTDPRVDVWSLGAVLHAMLTSTTGSQTTAPEIPVALQRVLDKCSAADPNQRFPTLDALSDALHAAVGMPRRAARNAPTTATPPPKPRRFRLDKPLLRSVAVVAVLMLGVGGTLWLMAPESEEPTSSAALPAKKPGWIGADRKLKRKVRKAARNQRDEALEKLAAQDFAGARRSAALSEQLIVDTGVRLGIDQSGLAHGGALTLARINHEHVLAVVDGLEPGVEIAPLITKLDAILREISVDMDRANTWYSAPRRCILMAPAGTRTKLAQALRTRIEDLSLSDDDARLATNYAERLDAESRAIYKDLLRSSETSKPCRDSIVRTLAAAPAP